jgi:hypothetical protein
MTSEPQAAATRATEGAPSATATPAQVRPSAEELPTSRLPSLVGPLPPIAPPPGPALKTQPLRAIPRPAAKRLPWRAFVASVTRAAAAMPGRFAGGRREPWTARAAGRACYLAGGALILAALVLGWVSVTGERLERPEPPALAAAIVIVRGALAAAAAWVGYALLRMGERLAFAAPTDGHRTPPGASN